MTTADTTIAPVMVTLTHARLVLVAMLRHEAREAAAAGMRVTAAEADRAADTLEHLTVNDRDMHVDWGVDETGEPA